MTAVLPQVVARLLAKLPTLDGWAATVVYDGPPVTADSPPSFVTVGFVDGEDFGATFEPGESLGDLWSETGTVRSEINCQTGDVDYPGMRAKAFALFSAWQAWVRSDSTLGVDGVSSAALSADLQPVQNGRGSAVRLAVSLNYTARGIYV